MIHQQHQKLMNILNTLESLLEDSEISNNQLYTNISDLLNQLMEYTEVHLKTEKKAFEASQYKFSKEHTEVYNDFVVKITDR